MVDHKQEPTSTETYAERSPLSDGMTAAGVSAGAGLFVSAVQNSLQNHNHGALGVFSRTGSTIALFTAVGGIFAFADSTVSNFRQKNDAINGASGGCAAGLVIGANARSIPMMLGSCAALAALVGTFEAAGQTLQGTYEQRTSLNSAPSNGEHGSGERNWREIRDERRKNFFKQKKEDVETE